MQRFDIVISGGSFVGLALARAMTAMAPGVFVIAIIEQKPLATARQGAFDGRSAAITASVKAMFETLGVWNRLERGAQPIRRIELTDSALDAPIRPTLLAMGGDEGSFEEPTASIIENADLRQALFASLDSAEGLTWFAPEHIRAFDIEADAVTIHLAGGTSTTTSLLVAADGQNSELRRMSGIGAAVWTSDKVGISVTVGIELDHQGIARQHFLPAGPLAVLPMTGNRVSIVWTEHAQEAKRILGSGRNIMLDELSRRVGPELGALTILSEPAAYPLTMTLAREFVRPRFALTGDAAHGLHWIAGQGLNHGLKDVAALAETLIDARRLGLDIGMIDVLRRYENWRRFDSATSAYTAATLNRLFSNDNVALRMIRSSGLRAVDRVSRLKSVFMKEAAGFTGSPPKLLLGQRL